MKVRTVPIELLEKLSHPDTFVSEESCDADDVSDRPLSHYFSEFWRDSHESKLIRTIEACGIHYQNYLFDSFYGDFVEQADDLPAGGSFRRAPWRPERREQKFFYELDRFLFKKAVSAIKAGRATLRVRKRWCTFSKTCFDDRSYGASISFFRRRIPELEVLNYWLDINPQHLWAFRRIGDTDDVRSSVRDFGRLLNAIGFVPPQNATELTILGNVPRDRFTEVIPLMGNCFYPSNYADVFGDYITALFRSGHLGDTPALKTSIGYRVKAEDGHLCNSLAEKVIDDWLSFHGIEHDKEPVYPEEVRKYLGSNIRADWRVGDTFIEYFGLQTMDAYARKSDVKILGCERCGVKLLALYPGDEHRLDGVMRCFLTKAHERRNDGQSG